MIAPKRITLRITPECITPFTLAIGPGLPIIELISIKNDWEKNLDSDMVVNFHEINYINK